MAVRLAPSLRFCCASNATSADGLRRRSPRNTRSGAPDSGLEQLPCLLVNWGYLRPDDRENLPSGIKLIALDDLAEPLARWL